MQLNTTIVRGLSTALPWPRRGSAGAAQQPTAESTEQAVQLAALGSAETRQHRLLDGFDERPCPGERRPAGVGQGELVGPAIARVAPALHQPERFEMIDEDGHRG